MSNFIESFELQSEKKLSAVDLNQDFKSDESPEESIDPGVLRLNSDHHHHNHSFHSPCTSCGCFGALSSAAKTNKRHSPEITVENPHRNFQMQLPKRPKKLEFDPPETVSGFSIPPGFSKINLPPTASQPESAAQFQFDLTHQSPPPNGYKPVEANDSSSTPSSKAAGASPLPPLPPLRRAWSLPSPPNKSGPSTSTDVALPEPQFQGQKLKVMGDWFKEVAKWWDEVHTVEEIKPEPVVNKQEEEVCDDNATDATKDGCEESVNVERTGECLIINFKCPCKKGYQILLCGTSCYYKLM
ncbi:hypothetical protein LINPERHAP1_LOCUS32135 [Linum perenne]